MSVPERKIKTIKITFGGESYAGRTKLIKAFLGEQFFSQGLSTIGVEKENQKITLKNGEEINLILFDTDGQERYRLIASSSFKFCNGAAIAFDLTKKRCFDKVLDWLNMIKEISNYPIALFGCKCDLIDNREISKKEIE